MQRKDEQDGLNLNSCTQSDIENLNSCTQSDILLYATDIWTLGNHRDVNLGSELKVQTQNNNNIEY